MKTKGVVIYGSLGLRRGISDLLWAFRKSNRMEEFPAYLDDHPFRVMERVRAELNAGMRTADVVLMPHYAVTTLKREGLLSGYGPKRAGSVGSLGGQGAGVVPVGVSFMAMAYSKKVLKKRELPETLSELAGPDWQGALGTQSLTASRAGNLGVWYLSFLRRALGEKEWRPFVDGLKKKGPVAYDCIDHLLQGLLEGEVKLGLTVYSLAYFREKTAGSPVALVDAKGLPHMMTFTSAALLKSSGRSDAARRFMDFLLTPEAQKIIGGIPGIGPVVHDMKPSYDFEHSYDETTSFHPDVRDFDEITSTADLFRDLGLP